MPEVRAGGKKEFRKGPPSYKIQVRSPDKIDSYFRSILRRVHLCIERKAPVKVKAYFTHQNQETAKMMSETWAVLWAKYGFKVDRLLNTTIYFEASLKELMELQRKLPSSREKIRTVIIPLVVPEQ